MQSQLFLWLLQVPAMNGKGLGGGDSHSWFIAAMLDTAEMSAVDPTTSFSGTAFFGALPKTANSLE